MPPLLVLVGPTAVGKSAIAVELALTLNGEVVTADSMQVYRGMNIATAKPTLTEQRGIPHHMIDVVDPGEPFNVARYRSMARQVISEVHERGNLPILSGGTGLYVKAVLGDFLFPDPGANLSLRAEIDVFVEKAGAAALHSKLASVDPETAARLHPNDVRRVGRAIEVWKQTGKTLSAHMAAQADKRECPYRTVKVGLTCPRDLLNERINQRVLDQIEAGLLEETRQLMNAGLFADERSVAAQAIGYKEMRQHLLGELSLPEAIESLQQTTRRYAKRQFTWFRRDPEIEWFDITTFANSTQAAAAIADFTRAHLC
jgi:tRNA dimethylallyltransferase